MKPDDASHLLDIAKAARLIVQFTDEIDRNGFRESPLYQSAILHQFLVLGEAVKRLSLAFRRENASIPWKDAAGMRDRLIHGYDIVNLDTVWDTATGDVPSLLASIEPLLPRRGEDEPHT